MQPRIKMDDVKSMSGEYEVSELHQVFYDGYLASLQAHRQVPDWLKDQDEDDYYTRLHTHQYDKHMQGEMAAWLSTLKTENVEVVTGEDVEEKYTELQREFYEDNPDIEPDKW